MIIDTENMVSMTEANQNFSQVVKKVDEKGAIVVVKNNKPKYIISPVESGEALVLTDDEKLEVIAKRILKKHKRAFEVLGETHNEMGAKSLECSNNNLEKRS